jgi:hypothetical protein
MNEEQLLSHLQKTSVPNLERMEYGFSHWDCTAFYETPMSRVDYLLELKSRETHYPELLIEQAKYDWLNLLVDGEIVASLSGESGWVRESLRIAGDGNHLVRWEYAKDKSDSDGEDRAWLDEVNWVPDRTGFALWAYRQGLSGDMVALMASDRDGDGLANGFEFAFGENWQLGVVPLQMVTVDGRLSFDYVAQDPKTLSEVELRVFRSTNLRNWSLVDPSQIETVEPNGGRCRVQVTGSGDRAFYRLEVGLKPQGSE